MNDAYNPPIIPDSTSGLKYVYNLDKQLTHIIRSDSSFIHIEYDSASCSCAGTGKPAAVHFDRGTALMDYDSTTGNLSGMITPENNILNYTYDGSLPLSTEWSGNITGNILVVYNTDFRIESQSINNSNTINYNYDDDGILTSAGAMTIISDSLNGFLTELSLANITSAYSYNSYGEVTGYTAKFNGSDIFGTNYTLDSLGRITSLTESIDSVTNTLEYEYNDIGYLVSVLRNDSLISEYEYDPNGNRVKYTTPNDTITAVYDEQDRLLHYGNIYYSYSSSGSLESKIAGNDTTIYNYDDFGNLLHVVLPDGTLIEYVIDGQNRRVGKKVNGQYVNRWLYQDQLNPVAELDSNNNVLMRFVYGTKVNVPDYIIKGDSTYKVVTDHLGSVRLIVNSQTGNVVQEIGYDEYGVVLSKSGGFEQPFAFAGGLYDEQTKLVRFGARDYDPSIGRWTAKDPILFAGGVSNLYEYCINNPINYIDPQGLQAMAGAEARFYTKNPDLDVSTDIQNATSDFLNNYNNMIEANTIGADKYFHCLANCEASKRGIVGRGVAYFLSEAREFTDQIRKGDTKEQCDADRSANNWGRSCPADQSCKERCSKFRPTGLDPKY